MIMIIPFLCFSAENPEKKSPTALDLITPEAAAEEEIINIALQDWQNYKDKYVISDDGLKIIEPSELFFSFCHEEQKSPSKLQLICMEFLGAFVTKSNAIFSPFTRKFTPIADAKETLLSLQGAGYHIAKWVPAAVLNHLAL